MEDEGSKRLSLKTLSDGGSFDDDDEDIEKVTELHKIQSELQEVVDKIDLSIKEGHDGVIKEESETTIDCELPETERSSRPSSEHVVRGKKSDDTDTGAPPSDMLGQLSLGK